MLGLRLYQKVVTDTEALLDVEGSVESQQFPMRHDTNSVGQLISFFQMLGAHYDRPSLLDDFYEIPDLPTRLNVEARGRLVQDYELGPTNQCHAEGQFSFHAA